MGILFKLDFNVIAVPRGLPSSPSPFSQRVEGGSRIQSPSPTGLLCIHSG